MIVAVAVCPGAPLLMPGRTPGLAAAAALVATVAAGRSRASQMRWSSAPTLTALGLRCADLPPSRVALPYVGAPFGVGYLVATWGWS